MTTSEERVAFILSQIACMNAERAAMEAENAHCLAIGETPTFGAPEFRDLAGRFDLGSNSVIAYLRAGR